MHLLEFAFPALILMVIVVFLLTWIDPEFEDEGLWQGLKWIGSGLTAFLVCSLRGYPPNVTAYMGATTLLWVTVFTGFRPGLMISLPRRHDDGWIRYETLYAVAGWVSLGWTIFLVWPVVDPYLG